MNPLGPTILVLWAQNNQWFEQCTKFARKEQSAIGLMLQEARAESGLSVDKVAKAMGIYVDFVRAVELGTRPIPSKCFVEDYFDALEGKS
jgi:hypothetical protein